MWPVVSSQAHGASDAGSALFNQGDIGAALVRVVEPAPEHPDGARKQRLQVVLVQEEVVKPWCGVLAIADAQAEQPGRHAVAPVGLLIGEALGIVNARWVTALADDARVLSGGERQAREPRPRLLRIAQQAKVGAKQEDGVPG